ncbi:MAG: metallophosphoesterase [Chlamydiota bacterium]|nr:metallophosphoesterase [Chlamydiota bacterium]
MAVWAIADLHLSFGVPNKEMHVFGENWRDHPAKIRKHWEELISDDDLVLIAGDISWAKHLEEALPDLEYIHSLPGTKVMIRGNHDYWWSAISKVRKRLPADIHVLQNDSFTWNNIAIGGARLWDTSEFNFDGCVEIVEADCVIPLTETDRDEKRAERLYVRELMRLESSLKTLDTKADKRIVMTHYPPVGPNLEGSRASKILENYQIDFCVFGHVHSMKHSCDPLFGEKNGVTYVMTAADYLDFSPIKICD